jgi:hypothetical protein
MSGVRDLSAGVGIVQKSWANIMLWLLVVVLAFLSARFGSTRLSSGGMLVP